MTGSLRSLQNMSAEDCRLVTQARDGDRGAGNTLALRYRPPAYLLALQLLGNPDDAMDIAQEALLRFFKTLSRFDSRRPVRPWLMQIVRNLVRDHLRKQRVRYGDSQPVCAENVLREPIHHGLSPEDSAEKIELQQKIWQAVRNLDSLYREILVLRDYQDLSYAEIAELLDIPMGTVMSRLHKARSLLRSVLSEFVTGRTR